MPDNDNDRRPGPVPAEVLQWWRAKGLKPTFDFRDCWNEEHGYSLAAAKVMRRDVLAALQQEINAAIADGIPFAQWVKGVEPRFREMGWWDVHEVVDPQTGKVAKVDPPSRLKRIFDTNMRTARAVGQWDRLTRNKRYKPFWIYSIGPSERHRPQHVAWHGLMLPWDDGFWSYAFPPSAHGCKCFVRGVSPREADKLEREGLPMPSGPILDEEGNPTGHKSGERVAVRRVAPPINLKPWKNARTGDIEMIPDGVAPGFNFPPRESRDNALNDAAEE
jgi:uncharacterized protein with gpF-like domain